MDPEYERVLDVHFGTDTAKKDDFRSFKNALEARLDAESKLAEINRRRMVAPAPTDFSPEPFARKIRLALFIEKTKIRSGERPRFRLELTNVGREPIEYEELESSIFTDGSLGNSSETISFYATTASKKRTRLLPPLIPEHIPITDNTIYPPKGMSEAQKQQWMDRINAEGQASSTFHVKLLPGETLRSLGDGDSEHEPFRTLRSEPGFKAPGIYQLQVVLDDRPTPITKTYVDAEIRSGSTMKDIQELQDKLLREALGPVQSNTVMLEVEK